MEKDQAFIIHKSRRWNGHGSLSSVTTRKWATAKNSIVAGNRKFNNYTNHNFTKSLRSLSSVTLFSPKSLCKYHVSFSFLFFSFLIFFSFFSSHSSGHRKFHNYTNHNFTRVTTITRFNFRRIKNSSQGSQEYITITRFQFTRLEKNHKIRIHNNYKSSLAEFPSLYAAGGVSGATIRDTLIGVLRSP